jgi:hypothetical protein
MRRALLAWVLSIALLVLLLSQTNWRAIASSVERLSPLSAAVGLGVWVLQNWLRALRFRALVHSREVPWPRMFSIVNVRISWPRHARAGRRAVLRVLRRTCVPGAEGSPASWWRARSTSSWSSASRCSRCSR